MGQLKSEGRAGRRVRDSAIAAQEVHVTTRKKAVHIILQAKGGVGKSYIASLLTQYLLKREGGGKVVAVDTDPANATLFGYQGLPVERVDILMPGSDSLINPRAFDGHLNKIAEEDADFVVDNGANCYFPLLEYMRETDAVGALVETGKDVFLHSVITGGQALLDTLRGFDSLATFAPREARLVVWLNEYYGPIEAEGKQFKQMQVYERHRERLHALVHLAKLNPYTSGKDIELMVAKKLTFDEVMKTGEFGLMEKQRIRSAQKVIFSQLALLA